MFHVPAHKQTDPAKAPGQIVNPVPAQRFEPEHQVKEPAADFAIRNHGSVCVLTSLTEAAKQWVDENVEPDHLTWGHGIAIEPRYVDAILDAINADGLEVV